MQKKLRRGDLDIMTKEFMLDTLLKHFIGEHNQRKNIDIPSNYLEKRTLLRSLINVRYPKSLDDSTLEIHNTLLRMETNERKVVNPYKLPTVFELFHTSDLIHHKSLVLWQGDITNIAADAIVNAANKKMLGCFIPLHKCIDNAIHSAAGVELRLECNNIMKEIGIDEATGLAKITSAYNLPSKYVLHTVGPIIGKSVSKEDSRLLASCYLSCLKKASEYPDIKTIAFCCISTGEFRFPKDLAAKIAINTVKEWLELYPKRFDKIIFNVFTKEDYDEYAKHFR